MSEEDQPAKLERPLFLLLVAIAAGGAVDLSLDRPTNWGSPHVVYELVLIFAALGTARWLWQRWRRAERANRHLEFQVAERKAERDAWRSSAEQALAGLAVAIDRQLETWKLTPAERDVAILLLKGRSHKEIAAASGRSERTIRQHAAAAYEKAGVAGRAELAAFFLTDLPLPVRGGGKPSDRSL
jgi:DNA-binding CsgD family transcriptional regulator